MSATAKLLVVDDEKVVCQSCSRIFSPRGFDVDTCTDSSQGLKMAHENQYNAILVDLMMPEIDGIEFLRRLREKDAKVPVMFITGYASVTSAAEAMRLGAADYVPKPFTPDEIIVAVDRMVNASKNQTTFAQNSAAANADVESLQEVDALKELFTAPVEITNTPSSDCKYLFFDESWVEINKNQNGVEQPIVTAGAFFSPIFGKSVNRVQLPQAGDYVHQGLPLAAVVSKANSTVIIPSPVSGRVVDVNRTLVNQPDLLSNETLRDHWIARIQTTNYKDNIKNLRERKVILLTNDESRWNYSRKEIENLGCDINIFSTFEEAHHEMLKGHTGLLIVDGSSYGSHGPALVQEVNQHFPAVKVVVGNESEYYERPYRMNRIMYYSKEILTEIEVGEILFSAFQPKMVTANVKKAKSAIPNRINKIQVSTPNGICVILLPQGISLYSDHGLGLELKQNLLRAGKPLQVDLGFASATLEEMMSAAKVSDHVLVLKAKDTGKIPGSVHTESPQTILPAMDENSRKVKTFVIQPFEDHSEFDEKLNRALADFLLNQVLHWVN